MLSKYICSAFCHFWSLIAPGHHLLQQHLWSAEEKKTLPVEGKWIMTVILCFRWTVPLRPCEVLRRPLAALQLPTLGKLSPCVSQFLLLSLRRSVSGLVHLLLAACVIMCKFCQSLKNHANAASWHAGVQRRRACPFSFPSLTGSINPIFPVRSSALTFLSPMFFQAPLFKQFSPLTFGLTQTRIYRVSPSGTESDTHWRLNTDYKHTQTHNAGQATACACITQRRATLHTRFHVRSDRFWWKSGGFVLEAAL